MIYQNPDGRPPSLLVREGHTVTINACDARELGIPSVAVQPKTTAAILTLAGRPPAAAPRLSDITAFERIERTEGLVSFSKPDEDGRIGGYTPGFLRGVLQAFNPEDRVPPRVVRYTIPHKKDHHDCGCCGKAQAEPGDRSERGTPEADASFLKRPLAPRAAFSIREAAVPAFLTGFHLYELFTMFGDIVVEPNATLILGPDVMFGIADNVLAYRGARIVQRASQMNFDVGGTMRGSLIKITHRVADIVKIDFAALAAEHAEKP